MVRRPLHSPQVGVGVHGGIPVVAVIRRVATPEVTVDPGPREPVEPLHRTAQHCRVDVHLPRQLIQRLRLDFQPRFLARLVRARVHREGAEVAHDVARIHDQPVWALPTIDLLHVVSKVNVGLRFVGEPLTFRVHHQRVRH